MKDLVMRASQWEPDQNDRARAVHVVEFVIPRAGNNRSLTRDVAELFCEHRIKSVQHAIAEHKRIVASEAFNKDLEALENAPANAPIELGHRVTCTVTGYQGTVTGIRAFLHGGTQMLVEDGRRATWIERARLENRERASVPSTRED